MLTPSASLNASGYAYNNAGKGGAITLSAGNYTGEVDTAAKVDVQAGARIDLSVKNRFTVQDMAQTPAGGITPDSTRTDLATGVLHLRESQTAFGNGVQFSSISGALTGASGVVLEGFQVFDLANSGLSTPGAIQSVPTDGLINSTVENAVQATGATFVAGVSPTLLSNPLFHIQPGAEIVNTTPVSTNVTNQFVVLNKSAATGGNTIGVAIAARGNTTINLAGNMPSDDSVRFTAPSSTGTTCKVTYADNNSRTFAINTTIPALSATGQPIVSFTFINTSARAATGQLAFVKGNTPIVFALGAPASAPTITTSPSNLPSYAIHAGDLALANNWDLSTYRFGTNHEPGNLTLRAKGNLVFGFDASLSDGFDPALAADPKNPLWTAPLMSGRSWSYQLVAGADYGAATARTVQPLGLLPANSGSILLGQGSAALSSTSTIPQYYQTIRTGTGDITVSAGRDVRLLNPLATIYTAGTAVTNSTTLYSKDDFELPNLNLKGETTPPASYGQGGGDVVIRAQGDIARYVLDSSGKKLVADSGAELPNNWLYRRGHTDSAGNFSSLVVSELLTTEIQSTSWWVDYSNFFADVGALGGGNVTLTAGQNVSNVNASAPTNARMPGKDAAGNPIPPDATKLVELGGGNVTVRAGQDVDGGVYYVERGDATMQAGGSIHSNPTRNISEGIITQLPTTFFLGKGSVDAVANGDILLGPVANTFLLPQGANNTDYERTFFSTYAPTDVVNDTSFGGQIVVHDGSSLSGPMLHLWYSDKLKVAAQSWLQPIDSDSAGLLAQFKELFTLMPGTLKATAFSNDITLLGTSNLAPSPFGTLDLLTSGNINGLAVNGTNGESGPKAWGAAAINLSDASPANLPGVSAPLSFDRYVVSSFESLNKVLPSLLAPLNQALAETGSTNLTLADKLARHGKVTDAQGNSQPLHYYDTNPADNNLTTNPVHLYAVGGDITGLTLYAGKPAQIVAGHDITDISFYVQNVRPADVTLVAASHDIIAYDPASPLRLATQQPGNVAIVDQGHVGPGTSYANAGDIQIAGPGTMEVLAGRDLTLGSGNTPTTDGTAAGITSVGAARNPYLPQNSGASLLASAGTGSVYDPARVAAAEALASGQAPTPGLTTTRLDYAEFIKDFLDPASAGTEAARYLPELATLMGSTSKDLQAIWDAFAYDPKAKPLTEQQALLVQDIFQLVLRNAARDRNNPDSPNAGTYTDGFKAVAALFPGSPKPTEADLKSTVPVVRPAGPWSGKISMSTREIKTSEGGGITLLVPGGDITVGRATDPQKSDQGILTERGGGISIFASDSVSVGTSRIFTLRGGNEILWSTWGNIAAGSGSKTVFSAPPTRVLVDPQSGDVQNDLAGLATGSGIGVLATLAGVKPGDVDLIAPVGTIDAGDAGIRSSGNLNIAARVVLNASNIQVGGTSAGTPPPPPAPNLGSLTAASTASAGASSAATDVAKQNSSTNQVTVLPSLITVEVLGYGGGDDDDTTANVKSDDAKKDEEEAKKKEAAVVAEPTSP